MSPPLVLGMMAGAMPGAHSTVPHSLGSITLHADQRDAATRLMPLLLEYGGALLADPPGSGKTFVALALVAELGPAAIVAPAALRSMWRDACERAGMRPLTFISIESLGRQRWQAPRSLADVRLLVVDEAHHARNSRTRRWRTLATLCATRRTLLMTATPVHNSPGELQALFALFLGSAAEQADLASFIVRRPLHRELVRPRVMQAGTLRIRSDPDLLHALLALPPPLAAIQGSSALIEAAGALATLGLVRAWASSDGALRAALRRRLTRTAAMSAMLVAGHLPDNAELARWIVGDGVVQLGLPGLSGTQPMPESSLDGLKEAVERHTRALRSVLVRLDSSPAGSDASRAHCLALLLRRAGVRIVAFSHSAETVRALFRELRATAGVALLTGAGARVAGGTLSRREALSRFAPHAQGVRPAGPAEEVRLLLTTDLLSEGVNLQDANVVVHLDLPWTSARLVQRVGRVTRQGSPHAEVFVYTMGTPLPARQMLAMERRLRAKARHARAALGLVAWQDVADHEVSSDDSQTSHREKVLLHLKGWEAYVPRELPAVTIASALDLDGASGALILVRCHGRAALLALSPRGRSSASSARVAGALGRVQAARTTMNQGVPAPPNAAECRRALAAAERWIRARRAATIMGSTGQRPTSAIAGRVAALAFRAAAAAAPHERAALAPLAERIGRIATRTLPAATESFLLAHARTAGDPPHSAWLHRASELTASLLPQGERDEVPDRVLAILILRGTPRVPTTPPPG